MIIVYNTLNNKVTECATLAEAETRIKEESTTCWPYIIIYDCIGKARVDPHFSFTRWSKK